ncbi:MAG: enoyl-CoA hydratase/isomerase family protein [Dehalococcoidia bacterium]
MDYETIILKKEDHIATITLNRPERMNAVNPEMEREVVAALEDVSDDDDVRVVVITGAGRAFCSGADVRSILGGGAEEAALGGSAETMRRYLRGGFQKISLGLQKMEKPTIAMVTGAAVGAGCDFAFACDMRVGSENARFRNGFVRIGLIPGAGGTWLYTRLMGLGRGLEFLFTGDFLGAEEAERIGVLNKVVPAEDLERETMELARKIAKGPPIAIRLSKMQAYKALEVDLGTALEMAATCQALALSTEDYREGVTAFIEKREAQFKGI